MDVISKKLSLTGISFLAWILILPAQYAVIEKEEPGSFPIVAASRSAMIYTDERDFTLIQKTAAFFQSDIKLVTDLQPLLTHSIPSMVQNIIIIGTIGKSAAIDRLIKENKIDVSSTLGKWEAYHVQLVRKPFKGIDNALVIAGSDARGAAYGVFQLSREIGVSPWYWWADVPVKKKKELYLKGNISITDRPLVKYRGIFINDEAPALSGWSKEKFGGFNHQFYEKVFELILRLKGNYLWPAMWGSAFYDDDTLNKKSAQDYGIVIGTSHHEPLMRAHDEWKRYGKGKWDYDSNETRLKSFWKEGMQRAKRTETIVSIGMRGDGDKPMTEGTAISLLERIVRDQRNIIEEVTGKPASQTPQLWALYKEVQDYYDKGMRVPDDVTLLLCDDNWGNIRRLPGLNEKKRSGGYGIYYHYDYVGDPRNYKWLNTNNIARVWEQMHLAYEYNARQIWIVNVGDIKPMEFPTSFFLDYAWNPLQWNEDNLNAYYSQWAAEQFGSLYANEIADIIRKYSKYNARRKPELLDADTYNIHNYDEAQKVTNDYDDLLIAAEKINKALSVEYRDAFFQLVLYPVKACDNLQELYTTVAYNRFFASQKWLIANKLADKAKQFYINDSLIAEQYNKGIAHGKWNHMMDQTHIGYTYWQQPERQKMPEVKYVAADSSVEQGVKIGVRSITAEDLIPAGYKGNAFYEQDGYISIEAAHYSKAINGSGIQWKIIPDIGRTGSGLCAFPVTTARQKIDSKSPHVEYDLFFYDSGKVIINAYFSPTLNVHNDDGLKYAISIDDEQPQVIVINKEDSNKKVWEEWVANNIIIRSSQHILVKPGKHVLKFWMIDPAVVLQKLVVDMGGMQASYLGPPETKNK